MGRFFPGVVMVILVSVALSGCMDTGDEEESRHEPQGNGCPDSDPTRPLPPSEHEVETVEDLQCAGQYVLLDEGEGPSWAAPSWNPGDSWRFQILRLDPEPVCLQEYRDTVVSTGTDREVPVYVIKMESFVDCEGSPHPGEPSRNNRTQESLAILRGDGYIHRESLFPLVDGKRWSYVNSVGEFIEATVHHVPDHEFNGTRVEAWRVEMEGPGKTVHQWWSDDPAHMIEEKRWKEGSPVSGRSLAFYNRTA